MRLTHEQSGQPVSHSDLNRLLQSLLSDEVVENRAGLERDGGRERVYSISLRVGGQTRRIYLIQQWVHTRVLRLLHEPQHRVE